MNWSNENSSGHNYVTYAFFPLLLLLSLWNEIQWKNFTTKSTAHRLSGLVLVGVFFLFFKQRKKNVICWKFFNHWHWQTMRTTKRKFKRFLFLCSKLMKAAFFFLEIFFYVKNEINRFVDEAESRFSMFFFFLLFVGRSFLS